MAPAEKNSLKDQMRNILEEARMILPGIQALFGFQTIAVFNQRFEELAPVARYAHLAALVLVVLAIGLVMAPAAWHRIVSPAQVTEDMVRLSSKLICGSLGPLALAISIDTGIVIQLASDSLLASMASGVLILLMLALLWFVGPFYRRMRGHAH